MARKKERKSNVEAYLMLPRRTIRSKELNQLSVHARWLYIVLMTEWKRGGEEQKSFIFTYSQIIEITGYRREMIKKCIEELAAGGFIEINHGRLCNKPNQYKANLDWLWLHDKDRPLTGN